MALMDKVPQEYKAEVVHWAAFYDHRLALGSKAIFHLEAFVAKIMATFKEFLIRSNTGRH